jgi:hypothetical protein
MNRSISTIQADAAHAIFGALGQNIIWAVIGSGIDGRHSHFEKHQNLVLPPFLRHVDFTSDMLDDDDNAAEALVDDARYTTHLAGIIAGEGIEYRGIAPKCKLVSLKVVDITGKGSEATIVRALRWILEKNAASSWQMFHGVLVTIAVDVDPRNYACGKTPVCLEVDELVRSGISVVAPAGNFGFQVLRTSEDERLSVSVLSSIKDPGNAELAVTVGSTHRDRPFTYGCSYFSSRGPTSDGRHKPDLLAPGERITSCLAGAKSVSPTGGDSASKRKRKPKDVVARPEFEEPEYFEMTGTGAAAAHVAGVIAALMSVRPELIGEPQSVKKLLTHTAIDLGRDRYAQGFGLVSLMRALIQSESAYSTGISPSPGLVASESPAKLPPFPTYMETPRIGAAPPESQARGQPSAENVPLLENSGIAPRSVPKDPAFRFDIAVSFPGEARKRVREVVTALRQAGCSKERLFYDKWYEAELSRPDLDVYLQSLYQKSKLLVVFLCRDYERKTWTGLEWRVFRDLIKNKKGDMIMPLRLDDAKVSGFLSIDGFIDMRNREPDEIADLILERLRMI